MTDTMRLAVPTSGTGGLDAQRSAHFGRADSFTVAEVVDGSIVGSSTLVNPPHEHGGCGRIVSQLAEQGVEAVIVVGMGGGPLSAMSRLGITAYHDGQSPTPRAAVEAFLRGELEEFGGSNACQGHEHAGGHGTHVH